MRDPRVILVIGAKKHGKSTFTAELVWRLPSPNALVYKVGVSVMDKAFHKFKHMPADGYTGGKVIVNGANVAYKKFLKTSYDSFRHGAVVIDDCSFLEGANLSPELEQLCGMCRFLDMDVVIIFHGLTLVPLKLFTYVNAIYLFNTTDNVERKLSLIPEGQMLMAAKERVARQVALGKRFWYEKLVLSQ